MNHQKLVRNFDPDLDVKKVLRYAKGSRAVYLVSRRSEDLILKVGFGQNLSVPIEEKRLVASQGSIHVPSILESYVTQEENVAFLRSYVSGDSVTNSMDFLDDILVALEDLHSRGIYGLDFRYDNFLKKGAVKVIDLGIPEFGLSQKISREDLKVRDYERACELFSSLD